MEGINLKITKNCYKCNGSGYISKYHHIQNGICFSCWGSGSHIFESNYPELSSKLKVMVSNEKSNSKQEVLIEEIKKLAKDFYWYESELIRAEARTDNDGMYYYDTKMNETITKLYILSKQINTSDHGVKNEIKRETRSI